MYESISDWVRKQKASEVEIVWPSGLRQRVSEVQANQILRIQEPTEASP